MYDNHTAVQLMGREVRRVPLDFDWPMKKVWEGYLLPDRLHEDKCPDCERGGTAASDWLEKVAYVVAGLADDADSAARGRDMHPWLQPLRNISYGGSTKRPGPEFAEFADGIAPEASPGFLGRDVYRVYQGLRKSAGLPETWGTCPTCKGHGSVEKYVGQRADAEAWEAVEPPTGDGWQMWETTSEGSPMSPVFTSPEELAAWLAQSGASMFGHNGATEAEWLKIITGEDFAHVQIAPGVIVM